MAKEVTYQKVDVVIVGCGISGICAACYLKQYVPGISFIILEGRDEIGGTWSLFKYPGARSDSDMHTFGYSFYPWHNPKGLAPRQDIREYLDEVVDHYKLKQHIHLSSRVTNADFDSKANRWTVTVTNGGNDHSDAAVASARVKARIQCTFLHMTTGYYQYSSGYTPKFEGLQHFQGKVIHPQQWDTEYDLNNKRMIVIGSGATAVTLVPAVADKVKHVYMLQRSPTYMLTRPSKEASILYNNRFLTKSISAFLTRWQKILNFSRDWLLCKWFPSQMKHYLLYQNAGGGVRKYFPLMSDTEFKKHFQPKYNPWDQRICAVQDGDLFKVLRSGKASIITDHIECFTRNGILLRSGNELKADVIVSATGLKLQHNFPMSTVRVSVDGKVYDAAKAVIYRGMMVSGIPNFIFTMGYAAASWTLRAEVTCIYWLRVLKRLKTHHFVSFCPNLNGMATTDDNALPLTSGYVMRSKSRFPKQGVKAPWRSNNHYIVDCFIAKTAELDDGYLEFLPVKASADMYKSCM